MVSVSAPKVSPLSRLLPFHACPGPAVQRQVQNGPTSEEMEAQRARWAFLIFKAAAVSDIDGPANLITLCNIDDSGGQTISLVGHNGL